MDHAHTVMPWAIYDLKPSQQTWDVGPMLIYCWPNVDLRYCWANVTHRQWVPMLAQCLMFAGM